MLSLPLDMNSFDLEELPFLCQANPYFVAGAQCSIHPPQLVPWPPAPASSPSQYSMSGACSPQGAPYTAF